MHKAKGHAQIINRTYSAKIKFQVFVAMATEFCYSHTSDINILVVFVPALQMWDVQRAELDW